MIRIMYLIDTISCDTAGTQKQLLGTITRLDRKLFVPLLVCLWQSEWMKENTLPCPVTVLGYRGFLKTNFPKVIYKLVKIVNKNKVQIIQIFFEDSIFVGALGKMFFRNNPALLSSRRDMGLGNSSQPWYHSLFALILPYVSTFFDGIIANSYKVGSYVAKREKIKSEKIKIIHNGVDLPLNNGIVPSVFLKNSVDVWICITGSLTPVKRHDLLIKAVANIRAGLLHQKMHILFLGEGPEFENLQLLTRKNKMDDIIHFEGAVSNVYDYLTQIHIGVLCSDREGLSNAILEYMACGLPVVATAVGGNTELVDHENGICVPPDDFKALANALMQLINDEKLRIKLGQKSLSKIKENFSWNKAMTELENYYCSIAGNKQ